MLPVPSGTRIRGRHSHELLVASAAAFFLLAHLCFPRDSLEDIDALNFVPGVQMCGWALTSEDVSLYASADQFTRGARVGRDSHLHFPRSQR